MLVVGRMYWNNLIEGNGENGFFLEFCRICPPKTSMYQLWSGELLVTYWTWLLVSRSTHESDRGLSSPIGKLAKNCILHLPANRMGLGQPVSWRKNFTNKKTSLQKKTRGTNSFLTAWRYDTAANIAMSVWWWGISQPWLNTSGEWYEHDQPCISRQPEKPILNLCQTVPGDGGFPWIAQLNCDNPQNIRGRFGHCPHCPQCQFMTQHGFWTLLGSREKKPWWNLLVPIGKAKGCSAACVGPKNHLNKWMNIAAKQDQKCAYKFWVNRCKYRVDHRTHTQQISVYPLVN